MKTKKTNTLVVLMGIAVGVSLFIGLPTAYAADIYVTKAGCPDPAGWWYKPYHMVGSAVVKARRLPGSTILIGPGKYYETLTIDTPCTLKSTGGTVTIGKMDYLESTTLDIVTLNMHLLGDMVFPRDHWRESDRANDIKAHLQAMEPDMPDVIAFQEFWDEDYFLEGEGDASYYDYDSDGTYDEVVIADSFLDILWQYDGYHGESHWDGLVWHPANSGLAVMSLNYLQNPEQVPWEDLVGSDSHANKGYIRTRIQKEVVFHIVLFNLHAQAGWFATGIPPDIPPFFPDRYFSVREAEMKQLAKAIKSYRETHPHCVVFAMGDFNIYSDHPWRLNSGDHVNEYYDTLIPQIGIVAGGMDAARNSPGFIIGSPAHYTYNPEENELAEEWDPDSPSGRLDYIFYFPSLDGRIEVLPTSVNVEKFVGKLRTWKDVTTSECSDHWGLYGKFKLIRKW